MNGLPTPPASDAPALLRSDPGRRVAALGLCRLVEHPSPSYRPRTLLNAQADLTCAFALDFSTGGERLTASAAGDRLAAFSMLFPPEAAGERLRARILAAGARSLNIAGNGAHSLARRGWDQDQCDRWVFECLSLALPGSSVSLARSGGQTGADTSGAASALALGIPCEITYPRGFLRRGPDGSDFESDPLALLLEIRERAERLRALLPSSTPTGRAP